MTYEIKTKWEGSEKIYSHIAHGRDYKKVLAEFGLSAGETIVSVQQLTDVRPVYAYRGDL